MKIKSIVTIPFRLPLKEPFHMSNFTVYDMHYVLVKVTTDTGLVGYGEATPSWDVNGETPESIEGFIHLLTTHSMLGYSLIGQSIDTLDAVNNLIDTTINPIESFSLITENSSAKAALEQALYSLLSQYVKKSLYSLFNLRKKSVSFTSTISILPVKETVKVAKDAIKNGAEIVRLKIGKKDACGLHGFERDIQSIKTISKNIRGTKVKLIADANQGFQTVKETISFCKKIEGDLAWLEQPLLAHDLLGFREIKKKTSVPLMADESIASYKDLKILLEMKAVDFVNIKLMKTGGYRGALAFINLTSQYKIPVHVGSMIESAYGIYMGLLLTLTRNEVISTDLNVYDLLKKQYCSFLYVQNKNSIHSVDERPIINKRKLSTILKQYEYK